MPQAPPYPVVFLGSLEFAAHCLRALADSPLFQIQAVITRESGAEKPRKRPVMAEAARLRRPVRNIEDFLSPSQTALSQNGLIAVAVSYGQLLGADFLKSFPQRAFNIHPSLLPLYRGAAPVERALMAGEKLSGVSLQLIAEKLDAGNLIGQEKFPILNADTALEVYEKAKAAAAGLLLKDLPLFLKGERKAWPQGQAKGGPYAAKIQKKEYRILWSRPAAEIHNQIRALSPYRGAWTELQGRRLKIYRSEARPATLEGGAAAAAPGEILRADQEILAAACGGQEALSLLEVQLEGKKKLSAREFLKGAAVRPGDRFF